jgi:hypothetical protein
MIVVDMCSSSGTSQTTFSPRIRIIPGSIPSYIAAFSILIQKSPAAKTEIRNAIGLPVETILVAVEHPPSWNSDGSDQRSSDFDVNDRSFPRLCRRLPPTGLLEAGQQPHAALRQDKLRSWRALPSRPHFSDAHLSGHPCGRRGKEGSRTGRRKFFYYNRTKGGESPGEKSWTEAAVVSDSAEKWTLPTASPRSHQETISSSILCGL